MKNTVILTFGNVFPKVVTFITLPLYTTYLTLEEFGTYDLITILVSLFVPIATLQIDQAAFRYIIDVDSDRKKIVISNTFFFFIPFALISSLTLYLLLWEVEFVVRILIILYLFTEIYCTVIKQMLRGLGKNKEYSISTLITSVVSTILVVPFIVVFHLNLNGILLSLFFSNLISIIYIHYKYNFISQISKSLVSKDEIYVLLRYSIPMVPNTISVWGMRVLNRLIITFMLGLGSNAIFAAANKLPQIMNLFQNTFTLAWQESASLHENDFDIDQYYTSIWTRLLEVMGGGCALLIAFNPFIFSLLINSDYNEAYAHIPILYLANFLFSFASFYGGIYVAKKETKKVAVTSISSCVINVLITILLIKFVGLYAASFGMLISYLVLSIQRARGIRCYCKISYPISKIIFSCLVLTLVSLLSLVDNYLIITLNCGISLVFSIYMNHSLLSILLKRIHLSK